MVGSKIGVSKVKCIRLCGVAANRWAVFNRRKGTIDFVGYFMRMSTCLCVCVCERESVCVYIE